MAPPSAEPKHPSAPRRFRRRADYAGTDLRNRLIRFRNITGSSFAGADMTGIGIESSTGRDAIFDAATMTGGRIERSHLERSTFVGARAAHLTANRCHLTECDFRDAVLMRARFEPLANLTGVTFDGAKLLHAAIGYAPGASFINAIATGCQFVGAQVAGCDFRCASLVHADFTGADLTDANFAGANLTLAHLTAEQLLTARGWRTATLDPALRVIAEGLAATRSTGPQAAGR